MKTIITSFLCLLVFVGGESKAQDAVATNMQNTSGSSAVINTTNSSADLSKAIPNVFTPSLSNVPETCAVSHSGGGVLSGVGIGIGISIVEKECSRRMNSRLVAQLGDPEAAKQILCGNNEVREAYESVNRPCVEMLREPQKQGKRKK